MKVACIGNMNNMMFTLCRYLRDNNVDAYLFIFENEPEHFSPKSDSYDSLFLRYTTYLPISSETFLDKDRINKTYKLLDSFDFFIGTDYAPSLLYLLNKKIDLFMPHGSDIYSIPFSQICRKGTNKTWWLKSVYYSSFLQKKGIHYSKNIMFPDEYDKNFNYKCKLNYPGRFIDDAGPMLYLPQYENNLNSSESDSSEYLSRFKTIRNNCELLLFSHSRHNGSVLSDNLKLHLKGNEVLIEGVSVFIKSNPQIKVKLILFDYGMNVQFSKELIERLEIEDNVEWFPKMDRKDILSGLSMADIAFGQFVNSWLTCGVVNEILALGKPLIHYIDYNLYDLKLNEYYYFLNAKNSKDICSRIQLFYNDSSNVNLASKRNVNWLENYSVVKPLNTILDLINSSDGVDKINNRLVLIWKKSSIRFKVLGEKIKDKILG